MTLGGPSNHAESGASAGTTGRKKPSFLAWLIVILPGLVARVRFGGHGAFRGMAGAILTAFFTISLISVANSESALPERLPAAITILAGLILLSLSLLFWGYRAFCRAAAKAPAGDRKKEGETE